MSETPYPPADIPILCFSTTDWDETWGSRQQLMLRLARRGHRVLFVERQVGPEQLLRDPALRLRKFTAWRTTRLRPVMENLWLYQPPLLPPGRYYSPLLNRLGQNTLAKQVQQLQKTLAFSAPILWLYPPQSAPLLGKFNEALSIYHCIENFAGDQRGVKRRVMQWEERQLLSQVDLVFVHARGLLERYQALTRRTITWAPSAADVVHFQSTTAIDPLVAALPHPRLGVSGTLDARIDIALLEQVAQEQPDWHLVLLGTLRSGRINLSRLLSLPNIHHLGYQPFERLPALLNGMDVLLIPYTLTEMTRFISPIKLYEYLAVGKPIVSTALPEVGDFKDHARIAETPQAFIQHIHAALTSDTPAQVAARRSLARQHSWDCRLEVMLEVIATVLKEKSGHEA